MPSDLMFSESMFPQISEDENVKESLKKVLSYNYQLLEQLRYTLSNLGKNNFNTVELINMNNEISEPLEQGIAGAKSVASTAYSKAYDANELAYTANEKASVVVGDEENVKASIIMDAINDDQSTIKIKATHLQLDGITKFVNDLSDGLSNGTTIINGACIQTGTLSADCVKANNGEYITFNSPLMLKANYPQIYGINMLQFTGDAYGTSYIRCNDEYVGYGKLRIYAPNGIDFVTSNGASVTVNGIAI